MPDPPAVLMDAEQLTELMTEGFGRPWTWPIEVVDPDGVTVRLPASEAQLRPGGTLSGPTLMTLADFTAYLVVLSRIGAEPLAVTTHLSINFLRRPYPGDLMARGRALTVGRTLAVVEVDLHSDAPDADPDRVVAHAVVTYSLALVRQADPPEAAPEQREAS